MPIHDYILTLLFQFGPWKLLMSKSREAFSNGKATIRNPGSRLINPRVYKSLELNSVYEIAVQMGKGQRRIPVLIIKPKDGATSSTWASVFHSARIRKHMNAITREGAKIYIRACTVSNEFEFKQKDESDAIISTVRGADAVKAYMIHNHDYVWCIRKRSVRRQLLVKGGVNIGLL